MRPLLNAAYWAQVNAMDEKRRQRYDRDLLAPERIADGPKRTLDAGQMELLRLMRMGG